MHSCTHTCNIQRKKHNKFFHGTWIQRGAALHQLDFFFTCSLSLRIKPCDAGHWATTSDRGSISICTQPRDAGHD
jgi:hypothetical protein